MTCSTPLGPICPLTVASSSPLALRRSAIVLRARGRGYFFYPPPAVHTGDSLRHPGDKTVVAWVRRAKSWRTQLRRGEQQVATTRGRPWRRTAAADAAGTRPSVACCSIIVTFAASPSKRRNKSTREPEQEGITGRSGRPGEPTLQPARFSLRRSPSARTTSAHATGPSLAAAGREAERHREQFRGEDGPNGSSTARDGPHSGREARESALPPARACTLAGR